jgi:hypothetical protein
MRTGARAVALILLAISAAGAGPRASSFDIAQAGCFHGDEVTARSGEKWSALFQNGPAFDLADVTISVDSCTDVILDEHGEKTGRSIRVSGDRTPFLFVRGLRPTGSKPLKVETAARVGGHAKDPNRPELFLEPGERIRLRLGRNLYEVSATGANNRTLAEDQAMFGRRLRISDSKRRVQELPVYGTILWAGDLDRDGKLDLYMDVTTEENAASYALFLSSQASGKELMRMVASRRYVGC